MARSPRRFSPATPLIDLHERVLIGDEDALNDLARHLLAALPRAVRARFPRVPDDWIQDAVEDAILDYRRHPGHFDASRRVPLEAFLAPVAVRNLSNRLQSERRRRVHHEAYLSQLQLNWGIAEVARLPSAKEAAFRQSLLAVAVNDAERAAILVQLDSPGDTTAFARAFGISAHQVTEQRREYKRFRDRIIKRFSRSSFKALFIDSSTVSRRRPARREAG